MQCGSGALTILNGKGHWGLGLGDEAQPFGIECREKATSFLKLGKFV